MRRRPDSEAAALVRERVARLLPARGGWVPAPEEPARSWAPPPAEPPAADEAASTPLAALLPDTVRGGRLDPGRRGALALFAVGVLAAAVTGLVVQQGRPEPVAAPALERAGEPLPGSTAAPAGELVVSVAGTVVAPGVVRLPPGSRVDDAVRAAGGLAPGADPGLLNLARKLVDGEQVLVGVGPPPGTAAAPGGGVLDLNTATADDLDGLPGIGPVLAERIVEWRAENGPFRSVDELGDVPGIGAAKLSQLEKKVQVG